MKIAFDESGNTGQNLLDSNQPYFALASVGVSQQDISELTGIFNSSAKELHFTNLKKYKSSRNELIKFLNHELINFDNIKYQITDKKFALINHIVDRFIEPVLYNNEINIYEDNSHIILSNLIFIFGNQAWDSEKFNDFLNSFQDFIRNPSEETINEFYCSTENLIESIKNPDQTKNLDLILESKKIKESIIDGIEKYSFDLIFPSFNLLADSWYKQLNSSFEVIHDNSKAIAFYEKMLEFLSDPKKMVEMEVGYGTRKMSYPLKFSNIELVDSIIFKEIQIADLIASSLTFGLKNQDKISNDAFVKEIWESKLFNMYHHDLRPLDEQKLLNLINQGKQIGTDPLDYLALMQINNK